MLVGLYFYSTQPNSVASLINWISPTITNRYVYGLYTRLRASWWQGSPHYRLKDNWILNHLLVWTIVNVCKPRNKLPISRLTSQLSTRSDMFLNCVGQIFRRTRIHYNSITAKCTSEYNQHCVHAYAGRKVIAVTPSEDPLIPRPLSLLIAGLPGQRLDQEDFELCPVCPDRSDLMQT